VSAGFAIRAFWADQFLTSALVRLSGAAAAARAGPPRPGRVRSGPGRQFVWHQGRHAVFGQQVTLTSGVDSGACMQLRTLPKGHC